MVGAVEHCKIFPSAKLIDTLASVVARAQDLNARHDALGLVLFVVGVYHPHRLACAQFREQGFGEQLGVGANHIVGGLQNGRSGTVVLLQLDHL